MEEHTDPAIVRRLYPDAEKSEAARAAPDGTARAHWDTPLESTRCPVASGPGPGRPRDRGAASPVA